MRNSVRNLSALAVGLALSAGVFAAGATPTTAVELAQAVDLSDAKSGGLIVVGLLVTLGVTLWGARLVLSKFMPRT